MTGWRSRAPAKAAPCSRAARLQPTPKHDRGVFFGSGQDPVRKDVLEMLFRMCDREGLTLIPTIEFATPLPVLERLRRTRSREFTGVELVDAHGSSWVQRYGVRRGKAAYYNPLDPRVQQAMLAVIREVVSRYGEHPAFGGVAIHLHPHGFSQMPDVGLGLGSADGPPFSGRHRKPAARDGRGGRGSLGSLDSRSSARGVVKLAQ